jgi:hypothetical protein
MNLLYLLHYTEDTLYIKSDQIVRAAERFFRPQLSRVEGSAPAFPPIESKG